jgi:hypothetical protein
LIYRRWSYHRYPPTQSTQYHGHTPSTPASKLFGRKTSQIYLVPKIVKSSIVKFQKIGKRSWQCNEYQCNLTITQAVTRGQSFDSTVEYHSKRHNSQDYVSNFNSVLFNSISARQITRSQLIIQYNTPSSHFMLVCHDLSSTL